MAETTHFRCIVPGLFAVMIKDLDQLAAQRGNIFPSCAGGKRREVASLINQQTGTDTR